MFLYMYNLQHLLLVTICSPPDNYFSLTLQTRLGVCLVTLRQQQNKDKAYYISWVWLFLEFVH